MTPPTRDELRDRIYNLLYDSSSTMQDMYDLDLIMDWVDEYAEAETADALPYGLGSGRDV